MMTTEDKELVEKARKAIESCSIPLSMPTVWVRELHNILETTPALQGRARHDLRLIASMGQPWQPIETAPKDGTPVDIWSTSRGRCANYRRWSNGDSFFYDPVTYGACEIKDATHWVPIPKAPTLT